MSEYLMGVRQDSEWDRLWNLCYGYKRGDCGRLAIDEPDAGDCPQDIPNAGREKPWCDI